MLTVEELREILHDTNRPKAIVRLTDGGCVYEILSVYKSDDEKTVLIDVSYKGVAL